MSPQRVADAAHIAPFLTHAVNHHGQQTLVPPENAGRTRKAKPRKNRSRTRTDRNARPEEERFNTGPRFFRSPASSTGRGGRRTNRGGRGQDRGREMEYNDEFPIPDYPPPSFLEAISTPPLSICPSTTTLVNTHPQTPTDVPPVPPLHVPHNPQVTSPPPSQATPPQPRPSPAPVMDAANSDTDSDNSLDIILTQPDGAQGFPSEERAQRDWRRLQGVEFPTPASSSSEHGASHDHEEALEESRARGRHVRTQSRGILESDPEDDEVIVEAPSPTLPKRRHMSLSPLRTLFPTKPFMLHDRTMSAHPSPSPYSNPPSSNSFFRSTTSLKLPLSTASFCKLPSPPSMPPSIRSDSFVARKLFTSKGKERAKESQEWEKWEIVESAESADRPLSIMSALDSPLKSPLPYSGASTPTQAKSSHTFDPGHSVPIHSPPPSSPEPAATSPSSMHPLSMRDRKVPSPPFVNRQPRRAAPPPPPNHTSSPSAPISPVSVSPLAQSPDGGPPLTSVRTRQWKATPPPPPPKKKSQVTISSPLGGDSWKAGEPGELQSFAVFQRALETPLPETPVDTTHFDYGPRTPVTPTFASTDRGFTYPPSSQSSMSSSLASSRVNLNEPDIHASSPFSDPTENHMPYNAPLALGQNPLVPVRVPSPLSDTSSTRTRRHYPGRPLPRPPPSTRLVDSTYAPLERTSHDEMNQIETRCPEGLLIDFAEPPLTDQNNRRSQNPPAENGRVSPQDRAPAGLPASSTGISTAEFPTSTSSGSSSSSLPLPHSPSPGQTTTSPAGFSEFTDLDVLVSRLGNDSHNGSDYDTLLLVSEFVGPATPTRKNGNLAANPSLSGRIEVDRRITKDGRRKLKISLLGCRVEKCAICMSQFKEGVSAGLLPTCQHAFHDQCIARWLARSRTCPLCRVPLDAEG